MLVECGLTLLLNRDRAELGGVRLRFAPIGRPACSRCAAQGSWTPAACMGPALLDRLVATGTSHKVD